MRDTSLFDAPPAGGTRRHHDMERSGYGRSASGRRAEIGFRPLYRQVYDTLLKRLADAVWQPGQVLPSEGQLATELGVSQGTGARHSMHSPQTVCWYASRVVERS